VFVLGAAIGAAAGVALAALTPAPRYLAERGVLAMPGSPIPLALIVIAFACKYVAAVMMATAADAATEAEVASVSAVLGGAFAGCSGADLQLFRRALVAAGARRMAALIALIPARGRPMSAAVVLPLRERALAALVPVLRYIALEFGPLIASGPSPRRSASSRRSRRRSWSS